MTLSPAEVAMLLTLPPLLAMSAFCSAAETTMFGLSETQRLMLRRSDSPASRAVELLLANPRQLLITILLANMVANVGYFVVSTVLLTQSHLGVGFDVMFGAASVLGVIVFGEVIPKMVANARRLPLVGVVGPPLLLLHRLMGPLRHALDSLVVAPLSRLTAPKAAPPQVDARELAALLDASGREGVIDFEEQRLMRDVIQLGHRRVREVMTPRVRMVAIPRGATREEIVAATRESRLTKLPVYEGDIDHITGELHVKRYLLKASGARDAFQESISRPRFVPEMVTLDHLLTHFRQTKTQSAIVVDEYGGTAGVIAIEDVVEQLIGDISVSEGQQAPSEPELIGPDRWRVGGDASVHDWTEAFGEDLVSPRVSTLGGLIIAHLGRVPQAGDVVELGNVRLEVERIDGSTVASAIIMLRPAGQAEVKP